MYLSRDGLKNVAVRRRSSPVPKTTLPETLPFAATVNVQWRLFVKGVYSPSSQMPNTTYVPTAHSGIATTSTVNVETEDSRPDRTVAVTV